LFRVEVLVGPLGCGKTQELLAEMAGKPGRYLFALPTTELIDEKLRDLNREAADLGTEPVVRAIHSRVAGRRSVSISREIAEAVEEFSALPHIILVVTHEGMMATDFACAEGRGWNARIDEVPSATVAGEFRVPSSSRFFEAAYDLTPVEGAEWHRVSLKADSPTMADMMADDLVNGLTAFHKRAKSPQGVFVDVADWRDARDRSCAVRWWSAWTPAELAPFASVKIAASSFFESLTYRAALKTAEGEVEFVRRAVPTPGRTRRPTIRIRYFAERHVGSTEFWSKPEGRACLNKVGRHLGRRAKGLGFWSGNDIVLDYLAFWVPGQQVMARIAGSNSYRTLASCAYLYSAKATPEDRVLMEVFGLSREDILRAREVEDVWQFAMRGAVREARFRGTYTIYVYDRRQAEALAGLMRDNDIGAVPDPECVAEAGIAEVERPKSGPKPRQEAAGSGKSFGERKAERRAGDRERKRRQREKERTAKAAAGTLRGRGRPRKADGEAARP
jgi:hypothetical protein